MPPDATPELSDHDLRTVQAVAYRIAGIRIADGKRMLVQHRLARRVRELGLASYRDYCALIARPEESAELQRCVNALTTNETFFFRHKQHWDFIAEQVIPAWKGSHRTPRAWCAACSTGEEPYSLAIMLREAMGGREATIDASDINDSVLRAAAAGVYGNYALQKVTPLCLSRHFTRVDAEHHSVLPSLRSLVRFRQVNLLQQTSGAPYDLVLLRNVLIYFDEASKTRALAMVAERMSEQAWLLIGGAESLGSRSNGFAYVSPGIYRKQGHG